MKFTNYLYPVPRLAMCGAVHPLPLYASMACRGTPFVSDMFYDSNIARGHSWTDFRSKFLFQFDIFLCILIYLLIYLFIYLYFRQVIKVSD